MKQILIWGAGREGRGFLADVFSGEMWNMAFVDKNRDVVAGAAATGKIQRCQISARRNQNARRQRISGGDGR